MHPGIIPAGFSAGVPADDSMIYFYTREGFEGPEYRTVFTKVDPDGSNEPAYEMEKEWTVNVDALWIEALEQLEEDQALSEEALAFLDADPLWLFGIADPNTQRALERTAVHPMLHCQGPRPCLNEWFAYLNADEEGDAEYTWVIESFAEVELPQPWTSFKGVGNVVCYLNNESNETDWKHPFYDYFAELLNHCRRSTHEDHIKLRINRLLWTYEAESQQDVQNQMPLVSPKYVKTLGDMLSVDLIAEEYMVRTLKTFLRAFSQMYHEGELDTKEVGWCLEIVANERKKYQEVMDMEFEDDPAAELDSSHPTQFKCIECKLTATCYCPECGDCMCESCFEGLHKKGNRVLHEPNHFILCAMCKVMPAKLQCTYTRGKYCIDCYQNKHARTLPKFLDLKPLKIDYKQNLRDPSSLHEQENVTAITPEDKETFSKSAPLETKLPGKWHAFYDLRGVKYYYNFDTQESLRRPQLELIKAPDEEDIAEKEERKEVLTVLGKSREPRLLEAWQEGRERPGHGHHSGHHR